MEKSCIVQQFSRHSELTDEEADLLESLERDPREFAAGETLRSEGDDSNCFFTLSSGWAYTSRTLADGDRQVLDIYLPGQVIGLREIGYSQSLTNLMSLTDAVVCPFPKKQLTEIFLQSPRLTTLFFLALAQEEAILIERIINVSRRPAAQRLAHFFIELMLRLNCTEDEFELPMNQATMGDTLGLSAVHISRTLKSLRDEGLVDMNDGVVQIIDVDALIEYSEFDPAYLVQDSALARRVKPPAARSTVGVRGAVSGPSP